MAIPLDRILRAGLFPALLLAGMACKRPETALRERPAQRVELVQKVKGMTPEEERALVARMQRLGYLPWEIRAEWEVLDRRPGGGEDVAAHTRPANLDPEPFLHPLPAGVRTEADVRAATLEATAEALLRKVKGAPEAAH